MPLAILAAASGGSFIVKLAVAVLLLFYVVAPLVALATTVQRARIRATPLGSMQTLEQVDPESANLLRGMRDALVRLGFAIGEPLSVDPAATSTGYAVAGEAPNGDRVEAYVLVRATSDGTRRVTWTNFQSPTRDFARTITSNSAFTSGIAPAPGDTSLSAPGMVDLERLHRLHEARVQRSGGRRRGAPAIGDPAAYVEAESARGIDNMVMRGYARRSGIEGENLRLTPKGAFLIAWRQLPPWRTLAEAKARRLIVELESRAAQTFSLAGSI